MYTLYIEDFARSDLEDCCSPGDVSESVAYVVRRYKQVFDPIPSSDVRDCLAEYGAWQDLDDVDRKTLLERLVFVSARMLLEDGIYGIE